MSNREPYRSPEQKLSDCEMLLERIQENELRLAARIAGLERGEYICKSCGLRKDSDHPNGDF